MADTTPGKEPNTFVSTLSQYLNNGNIAKATEIIKKEENIQAIKDESWEIVRIVCEYLNKDTYNNSHALYLCCDAILEEVAKVALPEEALLEFLEQAEAPDSDMKFVSMLKPLQIVLFNLSKRKDQSLGWCLSTIRNYVKLLPLPESQNLEGNEKLLLENDPHVQRISDMYSKLSIFYQPFLEHIVSSVDYEPTEKQIVEKQKQLLISFFLHLLDKPLAYVDLEWKPEEGEKSSARVSVEDILEALGNLMSNLLLFLDYNGPFSEVYDEDSSGTPSNTVSSDCDLTCFIREDKVPSMSISVLYYLVFAEGLLQDSLPVVYEPIFVFRCCLHHSNILLKNPEIMVLRKGLLLGQTVIKRLPDQKIPASELEYSVYCHFVDVLTRAMIYCGVEECRKISAMIFKAFLFKFDTKGRYLLMCNMQITINHSGTLGYIITLLKDMIHQEVVKEVSSPYFTGKCLNDLISGYCRLPNGAESDLIELADEIISSLNLLRFLLLLDLKNRTGIWNYVQSYEKNFFDPLREGLKLSRAHYKLKMRELNEERLKSPGKRSEVTITVGCQQLPDVPYDQKMFLINSALNAFDVMECLLSHVNECIESKVSN